MPAGGGVVISGGMDRMQGGWGLNNTARSSSRSEYICTKMAVEEAGKGYVRVEGVNKSGKGLGALVWFVSV